MCREQKGYCNLVDMPCWTHLLNKIGELVFDGKLLPELHEYLRLNHLIFARYAFFCIEGDQLSTTGRLNGERSG